jgi:hypothetical protein
VLSTRFATMSTITVSQPAFTAGRASSGTRHPAPAPPIDYNTAMKLQFPVYLIGGEPRSPFCWLKSKLDEHEYIFVFTSADLAQQFIAMPIKNPSGLFVAGVRKNELHSIREKRARAQEGLVVDIGTPAEYRLPPDSPLDDHL